MDGVAAEIAQEIGVLLQHDDVDAGAREQKAEHHAGRPAADDAAARGEPLGCHVPSVLTQTTSWPAASSKPDRRDVADLAGGPQAGAGQCNGKIPNGTRTGA